MKCPKCQTENPETAKFCSECATPLPSSEDIPVYSTKTLEIPTKELKLGTTFARKYQILDEIGKGGMGVVYKALDREVKEDVAIKILKPEIAQDKSIIERFRNELKIARKISHKNVCRMYDLNQEEGSYYITMEYVPGEDLKDVIRREEKPSPEKAINIAKQVCEGLMEAHRLGVVHRDLKPQNIMIDAEGEAKIMDFGIARSVEAPGVTQTGMIIGTPDYISPEQAEGVEADQRSDIYSLGVILYEMVTGQTPFKGDTALSVVLKHKSQMPLDPRKFNPEVSDDLSRLILICMEKDRERRYQTAETLLSDLRNVEDGLPLGTKIKPRRETFAASLIRKKLFIPASIVVLAVIAVLIWQLLPQKAPIPSDKPSLAVVYFENISGNKDLDYWRNGIAELMMTELSQSRLIDVLSGEEVYGILKRLGLLEERKYSSEDLLRIANEGRVDYIISGSYLEAGGNFIINQRLQKPHSGEILRSAQVKCIGEEEIFPKLDELTKQIKVDLNLTDQQIADDIDKDLTEISTSSVEAFKYYNESAVPYYRNEYRKTIELLKKAIELDPGFAVAYLRLSVSYINLGYFSEGRVYLKIAFELSDRASDRDKYRIHAFFHLRYAKDYGKAIEAYINLIQLNPDDQSANNMLGDIFFSVDEWEKALDYLQVNVRNRREKLIYYHYLANAYMAQGQYDEARSVLGKYIDFFQDHPLIHYEMAWTHICEGQYDLALSEAEKGLSLDSGEYFNIVIRGDTFHYRDDLRLAEEEYLRLQTLREPVTYAISLGRLAPLYLATGKFKKSKDMWETVFSLAKKQGQNQWITMFDHYKIYTLLKSGEYSMALEECNKLWDMAPDAQNSELAKRHVLFNRGLAYLGLKELDKAQNAANELMELVEKGMNKKAIRYYYLLKGLIELEKNEFLEPIKNIKKAISLLPAQYYAEFREINDHALFHDSLASAYYKSGDLERAREEYRKITQLSAGRLYYGDIYAKSFYMLGMIHEQQGDTAKAVEHYEKFLDLWKDADPGLPEVEDARSRMAGLKSEY
jgi:serine/threonine protein kinase/tetratricopeptide (TPR) repeat protein